MFSCEFCEISKNIFLHRTPLVAASDNFQIYVETGVASHKKLYQRSIALFKYFSLLPMYTRPKPNVHKIFVWYLVSYLTSTLAILSSRTAIWRAVLYSVSYSFTLAPWFISFVMVSELPLLLDAKSNGVNFRLSLAFTSAPLEIQIYTIKSNSI